LVWFMSQSYYSLQVCATLRLECADLSALWFSCDLSQLH